MKGANPMDKKKKKIHAASANRIPDAYLQGLFAGYELAMNAKAAEAEKKTDKKPA